MLLHHALCDDTLRHVFRHVPATDGGCVARAFRRARGAWPHPVLRTYVFASRTRLLWAFAQGYRMLQTHAAFVNATRSNDLGVLQALWPKNPRCVETTVFETALQHDLCTVAEWVVGVTGRKPCALCPDADLTAATYGSMTVLRWLHARGDVHVDALDMLLLAEEEGHFEAFAFLADTECCTYDPYRVVQMAAQHGDCLAYVRFLAERHIYHEWWSDDLVHHALLARRSDVLRWCANHSYVSLRPEALLPHVHRLPAGAFVSPDPHAVAAAEAWVASLVVA